MIKFTKFISKHRVKELETLKISENFSYHWHRYKSCINYLLELNFKILMFKFLLNLNKYDKFKFEFNERETHISEFVYIDSDLNTLNESYKRKIDWNFVISYFTFTISFFKPKRKVKYKNNVHPDYVDIYIK